MPLGESLAADVSLMWRAAIRTTVRRIYENTAAFMAMWERDSPPPPPWGMPSQLLHHRFSPVPANISETMVLLRDADSLTWWRYVLLYYVPWLEMVTVGAATFAVLIGALYSYALFLRLQGIEPVNDSAKQAPPPREMNDFCSRMLKRGFKSPHKDERKQS
jgi:hypothetical protein